MADDIASWWRIPITSEPQELTLELLKEAAERVMSMPYPLTIHYVNGERTWCWSCGPKEFWQHD